MERNVKIGDKYVLGKKIGYGSFGEIYYGTIPPYSLGTDVENKREVAIKLVIVIGYKIGINKITSATITPGSQSNVLILCTQG